MKPNSIFIVGCGDLGVRIERLLDKSDFSVTGVCRRPAALPKTLTGIEADYSQDGSLSFLAGAAPDYLVLTVNGRATKMASSSPALNLRRRSAV